MMLKSEEINAKTIRQDETEYPAQDIAGFAFNIHVDHTTHDTVAHHFGEGIGIDIDGFRAVLPP